MEKITVMHVRNPIGWYAVEEIIAILAKDLVHRGFNTIVVSLERNRIEKSQFLQTLWERGIAGIRLSGYGMLRLAPLMKLIKQHQVDILHTHTYKSDLFGLLAARGAGIKVVATVHGWLDFNLKLRAMGKGNRILLRYFDKIIFPSKGIASHLKGVDHLRTELIYNCVDTEKLVCGIGSDGFTEKFNLHSSGNTLAVIGRLSPEKGHCYLFEAIAEITKIRHDLTLLVVGEGPLKGKLLDLAQRMGISKHTVFTGYRKDIGTVLSLVDLLVVPSLNEGFCLPVIEALAFGKPVVASSVGVVPEIASEHPEISLVSAKDSQAMASAILNRLPRPGEPQRRSFSDPLSIPEKFSRRRMVDEYERVYRGMLDRRG